MGPDYIEIFSKLAKKKNCKVEQDVTLLLTVIDLVENGKIKNNEIRLNQELQKSFDEHCMKFLSSSLFDVYIPFWYLSRESFWHIVPLRDKDDVLELIDDPNQKPSKAKLEDSVNYAELDEDLFFLMTLSSGRKQLRAALISSCFGYNEETTLALSTDHSVEEEYTDVSKLYETLKTSAQSETDMTTPVENTDTTAYNKLPTNIKIDINFSFYNYLKEHPFEQELILNVIPDIGTFYNCIVSKFINRENYNETFVSSYESLLREMKIDLMSEDNSFDVIDKIVEAINSLQSKDADDSDNIDTEETQEDEIYQNLDVQSDAQQLSSNLRDGLKEQISYSQEDSSSFHAQEEVEERPSTEIEVEPDKNKNTDNVEDMDFFIEQIKGRSCIFNRLGEKIYSSNGRLKLVGRKPYRVYLTYSHITINSLERNDDGKFTTGERIIDAKSNTSFYKDFNDYDRIDLIQNVETINDNGANEILFDKIWYRSNGEIDTSRPQEDNVIASKSNTSILHNNEPPIAQESCGYDYVSPNEEDVDEEDDILETYKPKGKLSKIKDFTNSPYDYLWLMSIVDYMGEDNPQSSISMDELAIQMIANAWEANCIYPGTIDKLLDVKKCIEFYISESKSYMDKPLDWNSSKELILSEIMDYPIGDDVEDVMDKLVAEAPYRVDNIWIKTDNMMDLVELSKEFYGRCLYGIHLRKHDSFIQINPGWIWNLHREHDQLIRYYRALYNKSLMGES